MSDAPAARLLASFAARARPPEAVIGRAAAGVLDTFGVILAASALRHRPDLTCLLPVLGQSGHATVFGQGIPASAGAAALINGTLAHALEADDTHIAAVMHASAVVIPAAFAMAEHVDAGGETFLRAVVVGVEAMVRIGLALPGAFLPRGFQGTSVAGPLGAALAAGLLLDLDEDRLTHALGIAGSMSGGVFEFLAEGATSKWVHGGWPALAGVTAACLAQGGMTGPSTILEGRRGIGAAFTDVDCSAASFRAAFADLGARYEMADIATKLHPTCHFIQPFVECLEIALARRGQGAGEVAEVLCELHPAAAALVCEPWQEKLSPPTPYAAKWSLPYCLGAILVDGAIDAGTFDRAAVDPAVVAAAARIAWEPAASDFPRRYSARLRVRWRDHTEDVVEVADVLGGPGRPLGGEAALRKFEVYARAAVSDTAAKRISESVSALMTGSGARMLGRVIREAAGEFGRRGQPQGGGTTWRAK